MMNAVIQSVDEEEDDEDGEEEEEEDGESQKRMDVGADEDPDFDLHPPMVLLATHNLKKPSLPGAGGGWVQRGDGDTLNDVVDRIEAPSHELNMIATCVYPMMALHLRDRHHGIPLTPLQALKAIMRSRYRKPVSYVNRHAKKTLDAVLAGKHLNLRRPANAPMFVPCLLDKAGNGALYGGDVFNVSAFCGNAARFFRDAMTPMRRPTGPAVPKASFYLWTASTEHSTQATHYAMRNDGARSIIRSVGEVDAEVLMAYLLAKNGSCDKLPIAPTSTCARLIYCVYNDA